MNGRPSARNQPVAEPRRGVGRYCAEPEISAAQARGRPAALASALEVASAPLTPPKLPSEVVDDTNIRLAVGTSNFAVCVVDTLRSVSTQARALPRQGAVVQPGKKEPDEGRAVTVTV